MLVLKSNDILTHGHLNWEGKKKKTSKLGFNST